MSPGRKKSGPRKAPQESGPPKASQGARPGGTTSVTVHRLPDGTTELVPPPCARERVEDLAEVRKMIDAGEHEIAVDELRWLLNGCSELIEAHELLGELALVEQDYRLARAHFGYAWKIGERALTAAGIRSLPYGPAPNRPFFESAKGLCYCLLKLGKRELAEDVCRKMLDWEPGDPLSLAELLTSG